MKHLQRRISIRAAYSHSIIEKALSRELALQNLCHWSLNIGTCVVNPKSWRWNHVFSLRRLKDNSSPRIATRNRVRSTRDFNYGLSTRLIGLSLEALWCPAQSQLGGKRSMMKNFCKNHLEIPVYDAILVAVIDALQDLLDAVRRVGFAVELAGDNVFEQFASRHPGNAQLFTRRSSQKKRNLQIKDEVVETFLLYAVVKSNCGKKEEEKKMSIDRIWSRSILSTYLNKLTVATRSI